MNKKITALAVVGATLAAMPAVAQTAAPAAPAAAALRHGTPVAGLRIFSGEGAITGSQVGKFVGERLRQLEAPIEADLNSQAQAFEQSVQAYNAQQATLTPAALRPLMTRSTALCFMASLLMDGSADEIVYVGSRRLGFPVP